MDLRKEYERLRDDLNYHTGHLSSSAQQTRHPSFAALAALGQGAVLCILHDLDRYLQTDEDEAFPGWWCFHILGAANAGELPEHEGARPGVLVDWVRVWVRWGEKTLRLPPDRPKHEKTPPVVYTGWVVVGRRRGEDSVLCPKREPRAAYEETLGTPGWVSKVDAARRVDDGWWKKYAWILPTKEEADHVLAILNEKIAAGAVSDFNRPDKAWVEQLR
jgi:hypothetical protein